MTLAFETNDGKLPSAGTEWRAGARWALISLLPDPRRFAVEQRWLIAEPRGPDQTLADGNAVGHELFTVWGGSGHVGLDHSDRSHVKGEIIEGVLYTMTRPRGPHSGPRSHWVGICAGPAPRLAREKPYYARVGVRHHWLVDLAARTLTAYRLEAGRWLELGVYGDEREARMEPFDVLALDVASWWS